MPKPQTSPPPLPTGWMSAGSHPAEYEMSLDRKIKHSGTRSAYIQSIATKTHGFGTLMQTFLPDRYLRKRLRLSAYIKADHVLEWAGLWMRVDSKDKDTLGFDNMQNRPIKGTKDWTKHEIVLDIPQESTLIAFGVLLTGKGQVWFDDLSFEEVGNDVPTTNIMESEKLHPINLDFEDQTK